MVERGRVGETYNIGCRNERTNLQVVKTICDLLDRETPSVNGSRHRLISFVADRPGHDRRYLIKSAAPYGFFLMRSADLRGRIRRSQEA